MTVLNLDFTAKPPSRLLCIPKAIYTLLTTVTPTTGVLAFINLFIPGNTLEILLVVRVTKQALPRHDLILVIVFPVWLIKVVVVTPLLCLVLPPVTAHRVPVVPLAVTVVPCRVAILLSPRVGTIFRLNKPPICPHDPLVTLILVTVPRYTLQVVRTRLRCVFPTVPLPRVRVVVLVV